MEWFCTKIYHTFMILMESRLRFAIKGCGWVLTAGVHKHSTQRNVLWMKIYLLKDCALKGVQIMILWVCLRIVRLMCLCLRFGRFHMKIDGNGFMSRGLRWMLMPMSYVQFFKYFIRWTSTWYNVLGVWLFKFFLLYRVVYFINEA